MIKSRVEGELFFLTVYFYASLLSDAVERSNIL